MAYPNEIIYADGDPYPYSIESLGSDPGEPAVHFSTHRMVMTTVITPEPVPVGSIVRHMGQRLRVTTDGLEQIDYFQPAAIPSPTTVSK